MTTLISIDPSITCTGVAMFRNGDFLEAWAIKPKKISSGNKIPAHIRIDKIIERLSVIADHRLGAEFVVEITSGKTSSRHGGHGAGLGTYGMVVGQVVRHLIERHGAQRVHQVYENDWTRGKGGKDKRQAHCQYAYPLYAAQYAATDKGGDIADAILLGEYHMQQQRVRKAIA
jgi:hypothetical protein